MMLSRLQGFQRIQHHLRPMIRCSSTMAQNNHFSLNHHRRSDDETTNKKKKENQVKQYYHSTPRQEILPVIAVLAAGVVVYVAFKKYNGEPMKPHAATETQKSYQKMEQDLLARNQKKAAPPTFNKEEGTE
jgi:hypothetical protein